MHGKNTSVIFLDLSPRANRARRRAEQEREAEQAQICVQFLVGGILALLALMLILSR